MNTVFENVTFIIIRGIIALSIIGVGFYCIDQGIQYFALPRVEAEQIRVHFFDLELTANGLGAIIFGTGVALCYVGKLTAPAQVKATRTNETLATQGSALQSATSLPPISSETLATQWPDFGPQSNRPRPVATSSCSSRITEEIVMFDGPNRLVQSEIKRDGTDVCTM